MPDRLVGLLAVLLLAPGAVWAQDRVPALPNSSAASPFPAVNGSGMPQPQAQQQQPSCMMEFMSYKDEFVARAKAFQTAATGRKTTLAPQEACRLISRMSDTAQRWHKYAEAKASSCAISNEVVVQIKSQRTQVATAQQQICAAAGAARGPSYKTYEYDPPIQRDQTRTWRVSNNDAGILVRTKWRYD